jgi:hypothetical protein
MINLSKLLCISFLFISGCGAIGGTSRDAARAACTDINESDFATAVELSLLARDSGLTKEDWSLLVGQQCLEDPEPLADFVSCSQCLRAVGNFAWGS